MRTKILILEEKHGNVYISWSEDKAEQETICQKILTDRIKNGWYGEDEVKASEALG